MSEPSTQPSNQPVYRERRAPGIVWPALLISIGVILLLQQNGYIHWNLWEIALRLWPILIIAVGADLLIGRRSLLGSVAALVLVLVLLGGGLLLMGSGSAAGQQLTSTQYSQPVDGASSAVVRLTPDVGNLQVRALPAGSANLIDAAIQQSANDRVFTDYSLTGGVANLSMDNHGPGVYFFLPSSDIRWNIGLAAGLPTELHLTMGAGEIDAGLADLRLTRLSVDLGTGTITLALPGSQTFSTQINLGVGSIDIQLPAGAGATVHCTTGVGTCNLPGASGFWSQNYTSGNYGSAAVKLDLTISVGVGEVTVH